MSAERHVERKVVVLGAGPAGLSTGYALALAGWQVEVYEQLPQVGGLARTVEHHGFRFDLGGHRWFTKKDELNAFLIDVLGDELIWVDRTSRIYFDGKFVDYPLKMGNVLGEIGPVTGARAIGDFVLAKAQQTLSQKPIRSMEDAYVAQFGRTLYELFFRRYSEKLWGESCDQLSGDWVTQRSKGMSLLTTVKDALKKNNDAQVESLIEKFMYPAHGYGRISERMAESIAANGGQVHTGYRVVEARHDGKRLRSIVVSDGRNEELIEGDAFVSSIPMTELARILRPGAGPHILAATEQLTYRDLVTVHLELNREQVTSDTWVYVHDPRVSFARLHEPKNWSPALAPAGQTSLVLEVFCEAGDQVWQTSDEGLCELVTRDLAAYLNFIEPKDVIGGFAVRLRDAYPRYGLDYRPAVDAIKSHLRTFANLQIVGRGGTFRYNNADHAVETGLLAARNLLGEETIDIDTVNSANEYLEERRRPATATAAL
ncbi:MAG TPA: FAD-dependent oxidoreductase [Chloroflexota bacterium]